MTGPFQCDCDEVTNDNLMYHAFAHKFDKTEGVVSRELFAYLSEHMKEEEGLIKEYLKDRKTEMFGYLHTVTSKKARPDALCFFYLCKMYGSHGAIIGAQNIWYTFQGEGSLQECDVVLAYLGCNTFKNTCPIRHKPLKSDITFEAGCKIPAPDDNGERRDPTYHPKGYTHSSLQRKHANPKRRQAAVRGLRKMKLSSYRNPEPEYVVSLLDDDSAVKPSTSRKSTDSSESKKWKTSYYDDPDFVLRKESSSSSNSDDSAEEKGETDDKRKSSTDSEATIDYNVADYVAANNPHVSVKRLKRVVVRPVQVRKVPAKTYHYGVRKPSHTFKCSICGKRFYKYSALYHHKKLKHGCQYRCSICHLKLSSKGALNEHTRRHQPTTLNYLCSQCGRKFLRPSLLKNHATVHSDDKPWKCQISECDAAYKQKSDLTKHVKRKHSGNDVVKCGKCPLELNSLKALNQHMQSHNPANIPCRICGKKFRHYSSRTLHEKKCVLPE